MSKTFKGKKFEVKVSATPIKKLPFVILYIKINTNEKDLLFSLTKQYKGERLATVGVNPINGAVSMIAGVNGLVVECPENKIVQNITQYINYLGKADLKPCCYLGKKKGSFKKLVEDVKNFEIHIVGKCKTFIKNNIDKESAKIPKMLTSLDTIQFKDREDIEHKCTKDCCCCNICEKCFKVDDAEKIDVIMVLDSCDCKINNEKDKLCVSCCGCCCNCPQTKIIKSKLKIYRNITRELKEMNKFIYPFVDVRGLKLSFDKSFEFKPEVVKKIIDGCCSSA